MLSHDLSALRQIQSQREFRSFGITMGVILIILGLVFTFFSRNYSIPVMTAGGLILALGLLLPKALRPLFITWMSLGTVLGFFMTRILLGIIFFLIFTPLGSLFRLLQKDLLDETIDPHEKSYWKPRKPGPYAPDMSEKQS